MSIEKTQEDLSIKSHLSFQENQSGGLNFYSGFVLALRDARKATGRDLISGKIINEPETGSWLGAIGYMTLLDQIGSCFRPKNHVEGKGNSITKALTYFSSLSEHDIDAIYALRCAFAHDYSLNNIGQLHLTHRFQVNRGQENGKIVELPILRWDGDFKNKKLENLTKINLRALGNLVESICLQLLDLANSNELQIVLPGGCDELLFRYSVYI